MADTKNWTWVLERRCDECGFEAATFPRERIGLTTRDVASTFATFLERDDVRSRPAPEVWSILEYACHLRDVCRIFGERLGLMLHEDGPQFANWDQDKTAADDDYGSQDPAVVSAELLAAADELAAAYDAVQGEQWQRTGYRSDGSAFTVDSIGRYLVHDLVHHVWDIESAG
jgi:hypothetical protein